MDERLKTKGTKRYDKWSIKRVNSENYRRQGSKFKDKKLKKENYSGQSYPTRDNTITKELFELHTN